MAKIEMNTPGGVVTAIKVTTFRRYEKPVRFFTMVIEGSAGGDKCVVDFEEDDLRRHVRACETALLAREKVVVPFRDPGKANS